eukprot:355912-Chlamydomonas_euryale.AAC.4
MSAMTNSSSPMCMCLYSTLPSSQQAHKGLLAALSRLARSLPSPPSPPRTFPSTLHPTPALTALQRAPPPRQSAV